jgi:hypothetical protein
LSVKEELRSKRGRYCDEDLYGARFKGEEQHQHDIQNLINNALR